MRYNEPLEGQWFSPGECIAKASHDKTSSLELLNECLVLKTDGQHGKLRRHDVTQAVAGSDDYEYMYLYAKWVRQHLNR